MVVSASTIFLSILHRYRHRTDARSPKTDNIEPHRHRTAASTQRHPSAPMHPAPSFQSLLPFNAAPHLHAASSHAPIHLHPAPSMKPLPSLHPALAVRTSKIHSLPSIGSGPPPATAQMHSNAPLHPDILHHTTPLHPASFGTSAIGAVVAAKQPSSTV